MGERPKYRPNRIRELRGLRNLTQAQVARRMGVHPRTVYRWETSRNRMTSEEAVKLALILDSSVPWMLGLVNGSDGESQVAA